MDDDPFPGYGLKPVQFTDQALLDSYFKSLKQPLSDYTFSQLYTWRNSLRILWTQLEGHLCVFANGSGDLTMLIPPIAPAVGGHFIEGGAGDPDKALAGAWDIMRAYNSDHGVMDRTRIEYASEELLARFDRARLNVEPMGTDYVYDVERMIDLAGGDLSSKRQGRNRFQRNYAHRTEPYNREIHMEPCRRLLASWKLRQDEAHPSDCGTNALKRQKESVACDLTLEYAEQLGMRGLVVYVKETPGSDWSLRGFTFGETLGPDQSSIVIEKTDLQIKGLAQFIFSEFCRVYWSDRALVNVGDDWGLESLAWTKMSYRPVKLLQKYAFTVAPRVQAVVWPGNVDMPSMPRLSNVPDLSDPPMVLSDDSIGFRPFVRMARKDDLAANVELEQTCFDAHRLGKRQLQYLQQRQSAVFLVAEQGGKVVGQGISLVRHHRTGSTGRIYSLAVSRECRGQKIGRKLMDRMIEELASRGVKRLYLEVEDSNAAAVKLYHQLGFRSIGILPDYYGQSRPGLHMMREVELEPTLFDLQANVA